MTTRFNALAAIALACLACAAPAAAQDRTSVTARVTFADLDPASPAGVKTLRSRILRAAMTACQSPVPGVPGIADSARCRREMTQDGMTQIAQRVSRDVQVATAR